MSKPELNFDRLPITPGNYGRLMHICENVRARGGSIPPDVTAWFQRAESVYNGMSAAEQQRAYQEATHHYGQMGQHVATQDARIGYATADNWAQQHSQGIAGKIGGATAAELREIAANPSREVRETRSVFHPHTGVRKETTTRREYKYGDDASRRAALVLEFGKTDAERVKRGERSYSGLESDIDDSYLNSPHERTRDIARAMAECEARADVGMPNPTDDFAAPASTGGASYEPNQEK